MMNKYLFLVIFHVYFSLEILQKKPLEASQRLGLIFVQSDEVNRAMDTILVDLFHSASLFNVVL